MSRLPELPEDLQRRIEKLLEDELPQGYARQLEEAWDLLPDPKLEWNYWPQSIAKGACDFALDDADWSLADVWLRRGREAYAATGSSDATAEAPMDHYEARIKVARGDDDAYAYCESLLAKHGPRFFTGSDDKDVRAFLAAAREADGNAGMPRTKR